MELDADSYAGYIFYGWYENDILASRNYTYQFRATENRTIRGYFAPDDYAVVHFIAEPGSQIYNVTDDELYGPGLRSFLMTNGVVDKVYLAFMGPKGSSLPIPSADMRFYFSGNWGVGYYPTPARYVPTSFTGTGLTSTDITINMASSYYLVSTIPLSATINPQKCTPGMTVEWSVAEPGTPDGYISAYLPVSAYIKGDYLIPTTRGVDVEVVATVKNAGNFGDVMDISASKTIRIN
ncbi:MAG: hypothetical protein LBS19_01385 [Clostridiales bacterium]|nr:hypothetical protein [Clostridiales bacterium]